MLWEALVEESSFCMLEVRTWKGRVKWDPSQDLPLTYWGFSASLLHCRGSIRDGGFSASIAAELRLSFSGHATSTLSCSPSFFLPLILAVVFRPLTARSCCPEMASQRADSTNSLRTKPRGGRGRKEGQKCLR